MFGVCAVVVTATCASSALAASKSKAPPQIPLTERGKELEARYAEALDAVRLEIERALPAIGARQRAAFLSAYHDEAKATADELKALRVVGGRRVKDKEAAQKVYEAAKEARAQAEARARPLAKAMLRRMAPFLSSDALDGKLAKYVVMSEATPRGLAEFAQEGDEQEGLVERLLADADLMTQMVVAGGAAAGKGGPARYGPAMKIYTDIQSASAKASGGVFQRLALAVALEHAVPRGQRNATALTDAPKTVDPVKRYLSYEKAYLAGELDPGFEGLTVWEYRNVVNGEEPDETAAWGRKMLRNYRPDHISTSDYRWRYVMAVKTDVRYGSQDNKYDKPELQFFQNILMNGGVCGRRAFFGRFILRAFGVPTTRRPQRGHAALAHWTPDGWVVCLGAGWPWGWTDYGEGLDFAFHTQAREDEDIFAQSLRAQWAGRTVGEKTAFGFHAVPSGFWNGVALYRQKAIIEEAKAIALAAVGTDIGEANESKEKDIAEAVAMTEHDKAVTVDWDGTITVPAVACSKPTESTQKIIFMRSNLGGYQLHYGRLAKPETFEYSFDSPRAGSYALTARVVTPSWKQRLFVSVNGSEDLVDIALPFTVGMWGTTKPVEITLKRGKNILVFSRVHENVKGLTIKDFTLTPLDR